MGFDWKKAAKDAAGSSKYMKLREGKTRVRFFEFAHVVTGGDHEMGRVGNDVPVGTLIQAGYARKRSHFKPNFTKCGTMILDTGSRAGTCEICDSLEIRAKDPRLSEADKETLRRQKASDNFALNVIDCSDPAAGFKILEVSWGLFQSIMNFEASEQAVSQGRASIFGFEGKDIEILYDKNNPNKQKIYQANGIDRAFRTTITPSILPPGAQPRDLWQDKAYVAPMFEHLIQEQDGSAPPPVPVQQAAPAATPAATAAPAAAAKKRPSPKAKAPAAPAWPPVVDATVLVDFGDTTKPGTVKQAPADAFAPGSEWAVEVDGQLYDVGLADMKEMK